MSKARAKRAESGDEQELRGRRWSSGELDFFTRLNGYYEASPGDHAGRLENFPKYVPRQMLARFLALSDIFRLALDVQGDVIECGVHWGGCLMWFAQLSAILEPVNLQRRIVGFDTFSGFPALTSSDQSAALDNDELKVGGYSADAFDDLTDGISLYDANRAIGHIQKVVLVRGDANETIPAYLENNPHTIVSLLHLDFDLYEPTMTAIRNFVPRMPKGAVLVFDELNNPAWPGETRAALEALDIGALRVRRFPYEPHLSYAVLE